jgi:hypothetical protein
MKACVVKLLLWAPLIAGFAPLWRAPTRVTKTPSVHQLASSLSDDNDVNETDKIPDSAKYVIDTERGLDQEFEAFGAFLSGNETDHRFCRTMRTILPLSLQMKAPQHCGPSCSRLLLELAVENLHPSLTRRQP